MSRDKDKFTPHEHEMQIAAAQQAREIVSSLKFSQKPANNVRINFSANKENALYIASLLSLADDAVDLRGSTVRKLIYRPGASNAQWLNGQGEVTLFPRQMPWQEYVTKMLELIDIAENDSKKALENHPDIRRAKRDAQLREDDLRKTNEIKAQQELADKQRRDELAAAERAKARRPKPADVSTFDAELGTTKNNKSFEAGLFTHAVHSLAAVLDTRSDETLAKAGYTQDELDIETKKIAMHRGLADMLLSKDNLRATATALDIGGGLTKNGHGAKHTAQLDGDGKAKKNIAYLQENLDAKAFLEEQSETIPGLLLLIQSAMLTPGAAKLASLDYCRTVEHIGHGEPLESVAKLVGEDLKKPCMDFLNSHCNYGPPGPGQ